MILLASTMHTLDLVPAEPSPLDGAPRVLFPDAPRRRLLIVSPHFPPADAVDVHRVRMNVRAQPQLVDPKHDLAREPRRIRD